MNAFEVNSVTGIGRQSVYGFDLRAIVESTLGSIDRSVNDGWPSAAHAVPQCCAEIAKPWCMGLPPAQTHAGRAMYQRQYYSRLVFSES